QAKEHAVGIGHLNGAGGGAALVGRESHVATDQMNLFAGFAELPNPVIAEIPTEAAQDWRLTDAAGNRNEHDEIVIHVLGAQLGQQRVVLSVERDHALDLGGVFGHFGKGRVL